MPEVNNLKKLLVVGDWVVDDFWVCGIHRSPTSSRTGRQHFRAQHLEKSSVQTFCGAGRTASLLYGATNGSQPLFEVQGLGLWHHDDTDALRDMFDLKNTLRQTPFRMTRRQFETRPERVNLINLSSILQNRSEPPPHGTTRIIRVYQHTGSTVTQLQRFDWELQTPRASQTRSPAWLVQEDNLGSLAEQINVNTIDGVVIKDLRKGVVCEPLIEWMIDKFGLESSRKIPWFVSSKAWRAPWLNRLQEVDLRLLVVPQIAARLAILDGELTTWIPRDRRPSNECLKIAQEIREKFRSSERLVLTILPREMSAIAIDWGKNKRVPIALYPNPQPKKMTVGVNMASVCFAALIAYLFTNEDITIERLLQKSLSYTHSWRLHEVERFDRPELWTPNQAPHISISESQDREEIRIQTLDLDQEEKQWEQAFSGTGKIRDGSDSSPYIDLSRAMNEVNGYICCVDTKRNQIMRLVRGISVFADQRPDHHASCLLFAKPGSGKTYLVRRLAENLGFRFLPFNITQMIERKDVLDCFDTIVTNQAHNRDQPLLVFIDEINANLEAQNVYSAFLAPLEDGIYVRAGKKFHINPCVWIFASTIGARELRNQEKGSDFVSRLTLGEIDLREAAERDLDEETVLREIPQKELENVYLGVALIKKIFPDVRFVKSRVLNAFHAIKPGTSVRDIRHFVESFSNIQYGEVRYDNIPFEKLAPLGVDQNLLEEPKETKSIEIRTETVRPGPPFSDLD